mmetsp:Transcript_33304/g.80879  ORF Transcript_33304/g.80879 Transcript_33304/m.80879 type:complete len:252 (-) Transcript_33304:606-1361(-)|eukprot:CAMPEP_0114519962 /NCGR_PEP_ID=MMETSP0109-20121206/19305_1 /TAXON_ID=29199 /ORGANISM="Chlorarachnion reptans, Strain CCCM449" /LENGTH=251 /DNA_ID=CAMNT_0001700781 /DNA_START=193 /DNA_END=948 /DNA_ORIENTATION=-
MPKRTCDVQILSEDLAKINWNLDASEEGDTGYQQTSLSVPLLKISEVGPMESSGMSRARSHDSIPTRDLDVKNAHTDRESKNSLLTEPETPRCSQTLTPNRRTLMQLRSLRVSIPRPFKIHNDSRGDRRRRRTRERSIKYPLSPMAYTPNICSSRSRSATSANRHRPLHLWKTRHVARWASKVSPESVKMIVKNKLDGERLLRVENEKDLVNLGWASNSKLSYLLRDLQNLQTEDIIWHVNSLKNDAKILK